VRVQQQMKFHWGTLDRIWKELFDAYKLGTKAELLAMLTAYEKAREAHKAELREKEGRDCWNCKVIKELLGE